jgi:hypothetical protein
MLLTSGWMHWIDAVDFIATDLDHTLRLWIHTIPGERCIFEEHLAGVADLTGTQIEIRRDSTPPLDGVPDLVIKTTPDRAIGVAVSLSNGGVRSSALCYCGVVHAWVPPSMTTSYHIESLIEPFLENLVETGGDWHSVHVSAMAPTASESAWIKILEEAIHGM